MTIVTTTPSVDVSVGIRLQVTTGRNHIQKQAGSYSALYTTPDSRISERAFELSPGEVFSSDLAEETTTLVISTSVPLVLAADFDPQITTELLVSKTFMTDAWLSQFTLQNQGTQKAQVRINMVTKAKSIAGQALIYYGAATPPSMYNETFVGTFPAVSGDKNRNITINALAGEKLYYCYPASYGAATFTVNGFTGGFKLAAQTTMTTLDGPVLYSIYESENDSLGVTNITVGG